MTRLGAGRLGALLLLFLGNAKAAEPPVPIDEMVARATKAVAMEVADSCSGEADLGDYLSLTHFGRDDATWNAADFCGPFRTDRFCEAVKKSCKSLTFFPNCASSGNKEMSRRLASNQLRKRMFKKAADSFKSLLNDPALVAHCCGQSEECKAKLRSTKLVVLAGLGPTDRVAHYMPSRHEVQVSESAVLEYRTEDALEQMISHETGHACQASRAIGAEGMLQYQCGVLDAADFATQQMLERTMGVRTKQCVTDAIAKEAKEEKAAGKPVCVGARMKEAFADLIFMDRYRKLSSFGLMCTGGTDDEHSDPKRFLACAFERASLKRRFCGDL